MFLDEPINISDAAFERVVLRASLPVIVDFWSPSCGPCHMMAPAVKAIAKEFGGKVLVGKVNTDDYPHLAQQYRIMGVPTTIFFSGGKEIARESGALTESQLRQKIKQVFHL